MLHEGGDVVKTFTLELLSSTRKKTIHDVVSFIGEDETGQFGVQAGRERLITPLVVGLVRFRTTTGRWSYLALPGGVLYVRPDRTTISTSRFFLSDNFEEVELELHNQLETEVAAAQQVRESFAHLEDELMRRLRGLETQ